MVAMHDTAACPHCRGSGRQNPDRIAEMERRVSELERACKRIRAAERDRCANIADAVAAEMDSDGDLRLSVDTACGFREAALAVAERIRSEE